MPVRFADVSVTAEGGGSRGGAINPANAVPLGACAPSRRVVRFCTIAVSSVRLNGVTMKSAAPERNAHTAKSSAWYSLNTITGSGASHTIISEGLRRSLEDGRSNSTATEHTSRPRFAKRQDAVGTNSLMDTASAAHWIK